MTALPLAIDFGTSNSAAAIWQDGAVRRLSIEDGDETLPTAVFFPVGKAPMMVGHAAGQALIDGEEGRYMRALKSVLGTPLLHESRLLGGKRRTLAEIITAFLIRVKERAEAQAGVTFDTALSGRPVRFHSNNDAADAQAEADLRGCYLAAGFKDVHFMAEPEAAATACHQMGSASIGLIVDIGGGTSDFSVYETGANGMRILASHGIRLGGTDFDHAVSMSHAMPLLGHGSELRREMGEGLLPVPNALFTELSTWSTIPFVYTPETLRLVRDMLRLSESPEKLKRLETVIEDQLGHELAFAVEAGKIAANNGERSAIKMGYIERGLEATITTGSMNGALNDYSFKLKEAMYQTLMQAGVTPDRIGSVILVGGSSLMKLVENEARAVCPMAKVHRSEAFTAVVDGLAIASGAL